MKKQDYATLALSFRARIEKYSPAEGLSLGETLEDFARRKAVALNAADHARYLAEYLHVDKTKFLEACGLKP